MIGTSSPAYTFDVNKSVAGDFIARIYNTSATGFGLFLKNGDNTKPTLRIVSSTDGAVLDVLGNGNVGIGTSSPGLPLDISINSSTAYSSTSRANGLRIYNINTGANIFAGLEFATEGAANAGVSGINSVLEGSGSAAMTFYTRGSSTFSEKMRITSGGNVGIGTSSPVGLLNIYGGDANAAAIFTIQSSTGGSGNSGIYFRPYQTPAQAAANPSQAAILAVDDNYSASIQFWTKNTGAIGNALGERMRLTAAGELWVGYTADQGAYVIQANGAVQAASGFFDTSDIRLKNVLSTIESSNISAINYTWKDGRNDKKHWGYAAQDVMKILPDAVEGSEDKFYTVNYNEVHTWKIAMLENRIKELEAKLK